MIKSENFEIISDLDLTLPSLVKSRGRIPSKFCDLLIKPELWLQR